MSSELPRVITLRIDGISEEQDPDGLTIATLVQTALEKIVNTPIRVVVITTLLEPMETISLRTLLYQLHAIPGLDVDVYYEMVDGSRHSILTTQIDNEGKVVLHGDDDPDAGIRWRR